MKKQYIEVTSIAVLVIIFAALVVISVRKCKPGDYSLTVSDSVLLGGCRNKQ
jgi:hypothetical protein